VNNFLEIHVLDYLIFFEVIICVAFLPETPTSFLAFEVRFTASWRPTLAAAHLFSFLQDETFGAYNDRFEPLFDIFVAAFGLVFVFTRFVFVSADEDVGVVDVSSVFLFLAVVD
jgi:hypothetical protein